MTTIKEIEKEFKLKFKIGLYSFNHNAYSLNWIIEKAKLQTKKEDLEILRELKKNFCIGECHLTNYDENGKCKNCKLFDEAIKKLSGKQDGEE